ncbi:copper resistance CopC family protein [Brachybacterium sp. DNPG3]
MTTTTSPRPAPRSILRSSAPAALVALLGALLLALALMPVSASAHDTLISSDPEDGATVETSPEQLTFTFSADILDVTPVVRISTEDGTEVLEATPAIDGPEAVVVLDEPLAAGTYTIQWRVVSSDGHPIEGTQTLTVEQDTAGAADATDGAADEATGSADATDEASAASDAGGAEETEQATPIAEDTVIEEPAEEEGGAPVVLIVVIAVVVIAVIVAAVLTLRKKKD